MWKVALVEEDEVEVNSLIGRLGSWYFKFLIKKRTSIGARVYKAKETGVEKSVLIYSQTENCSGCVWFPCVVHIHLF